MILTELFKRIAANHQINPETLDGFFEDFAKDQLLKSETMQKALGVKDSEMEELYGEAYSHYEADRYDQALLHFRWLAIFNPFEIKYWMGFGASQQMKQEHEKALRSYGIASELDRSNPYPHFHAYECYKALGNEKEASLALGDAKLRAVRQPAYRQLKEELEKIS